MEDRTIPPSMKSVWAAYTVAIAVAIAAAWAIYQYAGGQPSWLFLVPLIAFLPPLKMHLARRLITLRFHDDHLTLETGFFSRTRRTVGLAKLQDVTVQQTFTPRIMALATLLLQRPGQAAALRIMNLPPPPA